MKGATGWPAGDVDKALYVSIHAPVKGATKGKPANCLIASFNPRAREGRDRSGAQSRTGLTSFNPRAREGRDSPSQ